MTNKKFVVKLSGEERGRLNELISKGKAKAKTILKARILLKADQGKGARAGPTRRFAARSTPTLRW